MGPRTDPPAITAAIITGLARPEFLVGMDAVAVVPEYGEGEMMVQFVTWLPALGKASSAGTAQPSRPGLRSNSSMGNRPAFVLPGLE